MSRPLETAWPMVAFEDRMATTDFVIGERAHITVDGDACRGCSTKACVVACPANLFVPTADGGILFNYEQCFECGTCYLACDSEGAITWTYPDGGNGVVFRPDVIAVCLKWVDRRPQVEPLDAHVSTDARTAGMSAADAAALEWALRTGEAWGEPVLALTAGPAAAESVLRDALAAGAAGAVRIDLDGGAPSEVVATVLAAALLAVGVTTVWCGDHSIDRGSGSVPAYLAAELDMAQALGLVEVRLESAHDVTALRRLDGGRRERLRVAGAAVLSVEGAAARLRRAPLPAAIAALTAPIDVRPGPGSSAGADPVLRPFRPRPRALPAPRGNALDRITALTDAGTTKGHSEVVVLEPAAAADRILEALAAWGYLAPPTEPAAPA